VVYRDHRKYAGVVVTDERMKTHIYICSGMRTHVVAYIVVYKDRSKDAGVVV
jgi:hypothetical protein